MMVIDFLADDVSEMVADIRKAAVAWRIDGRSRAEVAAALEQLVSGIECLQARVEFRREVN